MRTATTEPVPSAATQTPLRFWGRWALESGLGSLFGLVCGFILAYCASALLLLAVGTIAELGAAWIWFLVPLLAAGIVGGTVGGIVGLLQANLLDWPEADLQRWRVRSMASWAIGTPVGGALALGIEYVQVSVLGARIFGHAVILVELTAIFVGLVVGLGLWPALPRPAPRLPVWLAASVAATSLGWIVARLFDAGVPFLGLSWTSIVLGPLVYGMLSGATMLWVERRRPAVSSQP